MVDLTKILRDDDLFSEILFEKMKQINVGLADLELYEFRYTLESITPAAGWDRILLQPMQKIEEQLSALEFYQSIELKPIQKGKIQLDHQIANLTQMLFVGLVSGDYSIPWLQAHFYFDIRGFYFLHPTMYFKESVFEYLGHAPYRDFPKDQQKFDGSSSIGYKEFKEANYQLDQFFIQCVIDIVKSKGSPILIGIAGPTAAGKTEIVMQLQDVFRQAGKKICTLEMDNFLTDRDYREQKGIDSLGKEALHYNVLIESLNLILQGEAIHIPQYDFVAATSSHDLAGKLKPGCSTLTVEPADIIFIEGNFPFLYPEMEKLIAIKVVYLTDDRIRMLRKWRRDIDFRKKYDLNYFRNRYFREQFIMAQAVYLPQMLTSDFVVDTTGGAMWVSPPMNQLLDQIKNPKTKYK